MKWIRWIDTLVAVAIVALVVIARGPTAVWATGNCGGTVGCGTGFTGSYHDFATGPGKSFAGTVQITNSKGTTTTYPVGQCTLCHTPHKGLTQALLWNHDLSQNANFSWAVNATTMAGTPFSTFTNSYAGPTAKCLSCHDGSVTPTSINYYEGGTPALTTESNGSTAIAGGNGNMTGTHPVAMPYPCNGSPSTYNGVTTGNQIVSAEWQTQPLLPIRLYQEIGTGAGAVITRAAPGACTPGSAGIECSSCHDVHNRENQDVYLLRGYITGSTGYICQNCHAK